MISLPTASVSTLDSPAEFTGQLRLRFTSTPEGGTVLRERFRSGLFHTSHSYREGKRTVMQVLNPTAGIFENDRLSAFIRVDENAHAAVLSPSSSHLYTATRGGRAESSLELSVASGASLLYLPRWTVPHRNARYTQRQSINLEESSSLFLLEPLSAGRLAHGEFLQFEHFSSTLEIRSEHRLLIRERLECGHDLRPWIFRRGIAPAAYLASIYLISPTGLDDVVQCIRRLSGEMTDASLGITQLTEHFITIRLLAERASSVPELMQLLQPSLPPSLRLPEVYNRIL